MQCSLSIPILLFQLTEYSIIISLWSQFNEFQSVLEIQLPIKVFEHDYNRKLIIQNFYDLSNKLDC